MAAIELVDDRYAGFRHDRGRHVDRRQRLRCRQRAGRPGADWRGLDLARLTARTSSDGRLVAEGRSDALLGHPLDALAWLANRRSSLGRGLEAGRFVSLGTITPVQWVSEPCRLRIEIESLGTVELDFT